MSEPANQPPIPDQVSPDKEVWDEVRQVIQPVLQAMANASVSGDYQSWARNSNEVLKVFTSVMAPHLLENQQVIAPWQIPMHDIQMIFIHTQMGLMMKVMAEGGVFQVAQQREAIRKSSGLVDASGRPIISL